MLRIHRTKILALLLFAGGLAAGAVIWQAATRTTHTTTGAIGGGNVYTSARDAATCIEQANAFTDYPLVFAGPSVLGYPLTSCDHRMTKTRYLPDGRVLSPGSDSWGFAYGTCTIPENPHGSETCSLPITIIIDPCALTVDGRIIPKASQPARSMTLRGTQADISRDGVLHFEQSPQIISIYPPESGTADERAANAILIAEALVPANAPASAPAFTLARGAPLTTAFAASPDTLCRNSFVPAAPATAGPPPASTATPATTAATVTLTPPPAKPAAPATLTIAVGAPPLVGGNVQVPVRTTGSASAPYAGFSVHLRWDKAVFTYLSANSSGSVLASPFCPSPTVDSDGGGVPYACTSTSGSVTTTGLLATIVLAPAAAGCSPLHLFTFGAPDGGDATSGTYAVDAATSEPQAVLYADGSASVSGQTC